VREAPVEEETTLPSDPLRLRETRAWIARLVLSAGYPAGDAHNLAVAFSEACANVHRHAYRGRCDGRVGLHVSIDDERVELTLEHDGEPFDGATYARPDLTQASESGYGLFLITLLVDDLLFTRTKTGGRVVLVKRRHRPGFPAKHQS
jgi:anti-sigma regulatory factor (Ser/Thr protein kinase)